MFNPAATCARLGLLFALLLRLIAPAPRAAKACLAKLERELAEALRFTLADAGIVAPDLCDRDLIVWFNKHGPKPDKTAILAARRARGPDRFASPATMQPTQNGPSLDRRLPADLGFAGWKPAVQHARAPP